jgi:hypothetical protein
VCAPHVFVGVVRRATTGLIEFAGFIVTVELDGLVKK